MPEGKKILIIDSLCERLRDLQTVLDFCGFSYATIQSQQWQSALKDSESLLAVIIGELDSEISVDELLCQISDIDSTLPIIVMGTDELEQNPPGSVATESKTNSQIVADLNWPFKQNELFASIHACQQCRANMATSKGKIENIRSVTSNMVGQSPLMENTRQLIHQVANSDASVLILGESGTGKEIAARNLHDLSERADNPFVPINCGAIPAELLESELFGHEKGAFTGALIARKGRFELAEGGTIFLDEIGDMPMPMQVKLLRVLQERTFERVGSSKSIVADVRIIAATHRNLPIEVKENRFREDLFYRLNVFPIEMPCLRERVNDIASLANELVARLEKDKRGSVRLSPNAIASLMECEWPGNVRELANLMERLCILFPFGVVDVKDLPAEYQHGNSSYPTPDLASKTHKNSDSSSVLPFADKPELVALGNGINLKEFVKEVEISYIEKALEDEGGVVARAAKRLTMQRTTLVEKMRKFGLPRQ